MIIGDSLTSDMKGGIQAGIHTCWFNPGLKKNEGYPRDRRFIHFGTEKLSLICKGEELMIDTVIFDLGNVLAEYDWQGFLGTFGYDRKTYDAVAHAVFLNEDWVNGDAGQISAGDWKQSFIDNAPDYAKQIEEVYASLAAASVDSSIRMHGSPSFVREDASLLSFQLFRRTV